MKERRLTLPYPHGVFFRAAGFEKIMISNSGERPVNEPLASEKIAVDRKVFFLDLKENNRGRFLKITEDVGGRRDTIMLPVAAFRDFADALERLIDYERGL